jgi:preprotein translocase subunit SecG
VVDLDENDDRYTQDEWKKYRRRHHHVVIIIVVIIIIIFIHSSSSPSLSTASSSSSPSSSLAHFVDFPTPLRIYVRINRGFYASTTAAIVTRPFTTTAIPCTILSRRNLQV